MKKKKKTKEKRKEKEKSHSSLIQRGHEGHNRHEAFKVAQQKKAKKKQKEKVKNRLQHEISFRVHSSY